MTTPIPESWELLSHLAGNVYDMAGWRQRRGPLPDQPEGNKAEVRRFPQGRKARPKPPKPATPATDWNDAAKNLGEIEPYMPPKDPPELYDQRHIDALQEAGFEPLGHAVWHRESPGASHSIFYSPGNRKDDKLLPWHVTSDLDETGVSHPTLKSAIRHADTERAAGMSHEASVFLDWRSLV